METRNLSTDRAREAKNDVHPTKPLETATDHEIVWIFDSRSARVEAEARCNASPDAACRMTSSCDCEEWTLRHDEQGWFHTIEQYGVDAEADADDVVVHRQDKPGDCNICTWLNEGDILECTGSFTLELAVTPIEPYWVGPGYDWEPAKISESS